MKLVDLRRQTSGGGWGARAECAVADFDRTYGVGRIGRIFKGDGDWFVRIALANHPGVDDVLNGLRVTRAITQHPRKQIHQIPLTARAEIERDRSARHQCCAMPLNVG